MKTNRGFRSALLWRILPWLVISLACKLSAAETETEFVDDAVKKSYTLFQGADISVEYNRQLHRVQSIVDGAFVIQVNGQPVKVSANWAKVNLQVKPVLKLSGTSATVSAYKGERAFTLGNDPTVRFERALAWSALQFSDAIAVRNTREAGFHRGDAAKAAGGGGGGRSGSSPSELNLNQLMAESKSVEGLSGAGFSGYNSSAALNDTSAFDAMEFTFDITTAQRLSDPFVVFVGEFRQADAPEGKVAQWIYAQPIEPITAEQQRVHILRGGFPLGFEMNQVQMHLYNRGKEIPTTVSPRRLTMNRNEAFSYALSEYFGSHQEATSPAIPFMGRLKKEAKAQLTPEQLDRSYFVKVTKEGRPSSAFLNSDYSHPVDETIAALIANTRYYPALEKGQPINGVAEMKFSQLAL